MRRFERKVSFFGLLGGFIALDVIIFCSKYNSCGNEGNTLLIVPSPCPQATIYRVVQSKHFLRTSSSDTLFSNLTGIARLVLWTLHFYTTQTYLIDIKYLFMKDNEENRISLSRTIC